MASRSTRPFNGGTSERDSAVLAEELDRVHEALRGLNYGAVTVVVQDGVVVQIDRTEKIRLGRPPKSS
jgi:hypothetical protein